MGLVNAISPFSWETARDQVTGEDRCSDTVTAMSEPAAELLVSIPPKGRVFGTDRRVRFGDISPSGRARFDALAQYVQDIAWDDTTDTGLADEGAWVVRRSVFEVHRPATFRELLRMRTFCSGLGSRWAERRVALEGDAGADVQSVSLWVRIDPDTGRPRALTQPFREVYAESTDGRRVSAKLRHDVTPPAGATCESWSLRFADFDPLGHVNNAASWAIVEDVRAGVDDLAPPYRAELEYRDPIERGAEVGVAHVVDGSALRIWVFDRRSSTNYLTAVVSTLPG